MVLPSQRSTGSRLWKIWEVFWAFTGPIIAVIALWFEMRPLVTVEPSVNIEPTNLYATQILITNRGHVPVYGVHFGCGIGAGGGRTVFSGTLRPPDIRPIARLDAGQAITRSCDVGQIDIQGNSRLSFEMSYAWPLIGWLETKRVLFDVKKGAPGYFLVPDAFP
jgi:hypothetical protein